MSQRPQPQRDITETWSTSRPGEFTKLDFKPKRWHAWTVLLFILGTLFPPLAVAARFGFGKDFFINLFLTICGYIPGHGHNFYIQNIRNNKNHRRTPKWAVRYGLIDDTALKRRAKRSQWAHRYNERLPQSALEGQEYAEGQVPDRTPSESTVDNQEPSLWNRENDEAYYGQNRKAGQSKSDSVDSSRSGRWHYPANFEDTEVAADSGSGTKLSLRGKKKKKKDRWELSEDARMGIIPEDDGTGKKKKKKSKVKRSKKHADPEDSGDDVVEPEDPVGGLYGNRMRRIDHTNGHADPQPTTAEGRKQQEREIFEHQF